MEQLLKVSAVNFNKLQHHYRVFQTNDEVILFEYLLMLSKHFKGKKFYQTKQQFQEKALITPTRLDKMLKRFEELKLITRTREGMPMRTYFQLNKEVVTELFTTKTVSA